MEANDIPTWALVDSGASRNLISKDFVQYHRINTRAKQHPYFLKTVDRTKVKGTSNGVIEEVPWLPINIGNHHEELTLNVIPITNYDIILGAPWLKLHNPIINWETGMVGFKRCDYHIKEPSGREHKDEEVLETHQEPLEEIELPKEYHDLLEAFTKTPEEMLLPHQSWDHEIEIVEGKYP